MIRTTDGDIDSALSSDLYIVKHYQLSCSLQVLPLELELLYFGMNQKHSTTQYTSR